MSTAVHTRRVFRVVAAVAFLPLILVTVAFGQQVRAPLAERIPPDALLYAGWCGSPAASELYAGSHAEALLGASNLPLLFEQTLPGLADALEKQNPDVRPWSKFFTEIYPILFRHPTAFAFGGVDWDAQPEPLPRILLVCDAGDEAAVLRNKLAELFEMIRKVELVTLVDVKDGVVYMSLGWQRLDIAMAENDAARSLATEKRFQAAMTGLMERPTQALFIDVPGIIALAEEGTRRDKTEAEVTQFKQFVEATGLRGVGNVAVTCGFQDKLYHTAAFVETRGPRTGLLELLDNKPIDETLLAAIPADAGLVAAGRADLAKLLTFARNAIQVTQPNTAGDFEQGLKFINMYLGADIERDLLEALGETWAAYAAPNTGDGLLGVVAVNRPDSAERVRSAMTSLSLSLVSLVNQNQQNKGQSFRLVGRQVRVDGGDVYYLDLPAIAPAWRAADGLVYFGLYPQSVVSATATAGGATFESTEAYAAVRALAGDHPIRGFTYADLPRYAGASYNAIGFYVQLGSGMLSSFGEAGGVDVRVPPMVLPDFATFRQHITPAIGVSWTDERGLHLRSTEPFPMSGVLLLGAAR